MKLLQNSDQNNRTTETTTTNNEPSMTNKLADAPAEQVSHPAKATGT